MTHIQNNSGNQEHYSPSRFVESAREVMGSIDLDPASNELANSWIKATSIYTKEDCGLSKVWTGNLWLNPPYDSKMLKLFVDKLVGSDVQATVLTNNNTETACGQKLLKWCDSICLINKRVRFIKPDGTENKTPLQGQVIYYKGSNCTKFFQEFSQHDVVFERNKV